MEKPSELLTGTLLFIVGLALLGGAGYLLKDKIDFFSHSIQVEGIVVDVQSSRSNGTTYFRPLVLYRADDDLPYTFLPQTGSSGAFYYSKGEIVAVRYLEHNPQTAKLNNFMDLWGLPMALLVAGVVVTLVGGKAIYEYFGLKRGD